MDAIDKLIAEHRLILRALDALDGCVTALAASRTAADRRADLDAFVAFFREFAEREHHAKEESVLFAAVTDGGLPREDEVVESLLSDHETGHRFVLRLHELTSRQGPWNEDHVDDAIREARSYSSFMRAHVHEEDTVLFPLVRQRLTPALAEKLDRGMARFEADPARRERHQRLTGLAEDLIAKHGP